MDREHWELNPRFNLASVSDRGLKHSDNQDFVSLKSLSNETYIVVVCDGVSSSARAELASQVAAQKTCSALAELVFQGNSSSKVMNEAITSAQQAVSQLKLTSREGESEAPSTTLVAALVQNNQLTLGWLGDSRAYWLSSKGSYLLTKDHSWFNQAVSSGKMTVEQASQHRQAHAITRWVGGTSERFHLPSIKTLKLPLKGHLLLCSDGMWNYAPKSANLAKLVFSSEQDDALNISRHLVEFAKSSGGHDNITVAILSFQEIF